MSVFLYAEDELCQVLGEAILHHVDAHARVVSRATGGFGVIKASLSKYGQLSRQVPVLVVVDLDRAACPVALMEAWGVDGGRFPDLCFRIAVRECESWLMADPEAAARYFGMQPVHLPREPDDEEDPKASFLSVLRRRSRGKRRLIDEMLPAKGAESVVGLGYNTHLRAFVETEWSVARAMTRSESLARAVRGVHTLLS